MENCFDKKNVAQQLLQRIWVIGLMESWFCIWDDCSTSSLSLVLLRPFVPQKSGTRVANPKNGLNLVPNPLEYQDVMRELCRNYADKINQKINIRLS